MQVDRTLKVVIAGGGTGGHVLPAVAVVHELHARGVPLSCLWVGSSAGVEREAADREDIPFAAIQTGKLRRYLSAKTATDAFRIPVGFGQAFRVLRWFKPDVVFSTGGFVSVPTVLAAARLAPILTHEQTAILGLATRINLRVADVLAVSYPESVQLAGNRQDRAVVTGNPARASLQSGVDSRGLSRFNFSPDLPLIYVTGGARGASPVNHRIAALLPNLLDRCQILHQTGPASVNDDARTLRTRWETWPEHRQRRYHVVEFIGDELPDVYAAASLVIGRAGAGTVAELAFLGKPSILIPLPGTGGDEQVRNAAILSNAGASAVILQDQATPERLRQE
ncbi:MAG: UDP-N-acetylglucosamine--N-acetylmuramyl-(pentapeptide) pyrophosphoryl-undecaprenol N-acetylglucosamine transferase, partial [Thermomicrobiales bacterium]